MADGDVVAAKAVTVAPYGAVAGRREVPDGLGRCRVAGPSRSVSPHVSCTSWLGPMSTRWCQRGVTPLTEPGLWEMDWEMRSPCFWGFLGWEMNRDMSQEMASPRSGSWNVPTLCCLVSMSSGNES